MRRIIGHFTDDDLYKFTMCCAVIDNFPRAQVIYEFTDRNNTVYPPGFATALEEQIAMLENLTITEEEIDFMKRRCPYIPYWFYNYLRGFRYSRDRVTVRQDASGHLSLRIEGCWADTILLEVKLLAIISELYNMINGRDSEIDLDSYFDKTYHKGEQLIQAGCVFSDFGTRRRASFNVQDTVVSALKRAGGHVEGEGHFTGTSNVYLAMKHDVTPIGTMAHELVCAIAGMYGPQLANYKAMETWATTYRGALGTFLYDTYGWKIFSLNFSEDYANMFKGLRVDSGDNREQLDLIVNKYRSLNIDPSGKQVVFSNALDTQSVIELQKYAKGKCQPSYGIGTHFTNDLEGIPHLNIVIKLVAVKITESWDFWNDTCKLSEDKGKYTGKPEVVRRFMETLHIPIENMQR